MGKNHFLQQILPKKTRGAKNAFFGELLIFIVPSEERFRTVLSLEKNLTFVFETSAL